MRGNGEDGEEFSLTYTTKEKGMMVKSCSRASTEVVESSSFENFRMQLEAVLKKKIKKKSSPLKADLLRFGGWSGWSRWPLKVLPTHITPLFNKTAISSPCCPLDQFGRKYTIYLFAWSYKKHIHILNTASHELFKIWIRLIHCLLWNFLNLFWHYFHNGSVSCTNCN